MPLQFLPRRWFPHPHPRAGTGPGERGQVRIPAWTAVHARAALGMWRQVRRLRRRREAAATFAGT
ncbi:hypothetical protein KW843_16840 [Acidovorax sp. sif1233]|uniref:hypothetical protein n=1 Tax=unclassified Acidovorax TaxID=2684926 RepID=UPI001C439D16|nr:hypothetical protein [Acidovorax sp. sif1233]MBV7456151.1 hypothetical protein [Acidovorax sp. sif1233]